MNQTERSVESPEAVGDRTLAFNRALRTLQNYSFRYASLPSDENEKLLDRVTAEIERMYLAETQR